MLASDPTPPRRDKPMPLDITGIDHVQIAVPQRAGSGMPEILPRCLRLSRTCEAGRTAVPRRRLVSGRCAQMHIGVDPDGSPKSKRHVCFLMQRPRGGQGRDPCARHRYRGRKRGRGSFALLHPRPGRQPDRDRSEVSQIEHCRHRTDSNVYRAQPATCSVWTLARRRSAWRSPILC